MTLVTRLIGFACALTPPWLVAGCADKGETLEPTICDSGRSPKLVDYDADDERIVASGRVELTDPKSPKFSASAVNFRARFRGDKVQVRLEDEFRYGRRNYYDVYVDDLDPVLLTPELGQDSYAIDVELECKEHEVMLVKRTEGAAGYGNFLGFSVAELLSPESESESESETEPDTDTARKIEVIGDSITCGAGIEAKDGDPICTGDEWGLPVENPAKAYGWLLAEAYHAKLHATCVSGIGLVRNYDDNNDPRTMPDVYDLIHPQLTDSPKYETKDYVPDAIFIALGTNDFSPGAKWESEPKPPMELEAFRDEMIEFVDTLRGHYPKAKIILVSSPMLGNGWPDASYQSRSTQRDALTAVEEHYQDDGPAVKTILMDSLDGAGCGTHPDANAHAYMAEKIVKDAADLLDW